MKKVFQSKIFQIAIFLILIVAVVAGLIFVVRKNKMKDQTYKETILLQDETDENGMCINAFGDDMLVQYVHPIDKNNPGLAVSDLSHGFRIYQLTDGQKEFFPIQNPIKQKDVVEKFSDGSYLENSYWYCGLDICKDSIVSLFNVFQINRSKDDAEHEIVSIDSRVYRYSLTGEYIEDFSLDCDEGVLPIQYKTVADNNYIYAICHDSSENEILSVFDYKGKAIYSKDLSGDISIIKCSGEGAAFTDGKAVYYVCGDQCKKINIGSYDCIFQSGDSVYDFVYRKENAIYGYQISKKKSKTLIQSSVEELQGFHFSSECYYRKESLYRAYCNGSSMTDSLEVIHKGIRPSQRNEKKLIIASIGSLGVDNLTSEFRKKHPEYHVEIREFENEGKLMEALGKGDQIDIVNLAGVNTEHLTDKNMLVDFYSCMDGDGSLSKDDFIPEVRGILETDGCLYEATNGYFPVTIIGYDNITDERGDWNYEALNAHVMMYPGVFYREELIKYAFLHYHDRTINYSDSETSLLKPRSCNFRNVRFEEMFIDSKKFKSVEELYNNPNGDVDWLKLLDERGFIEVSMDFRDMAYISSYNKKGGRNIRLLGYPLADTNVTFYAEAVMYGVLANSLEKEMAWEYVKPLFEKEYQAKECYRNGFFPIRKDVLEILNKTICATDEYTDEVLGNVPAFESDRVFGVSYSGSKWAAADEDDILKYEEILYNARRYPNNDFVLSVLNEEAHAYWQGNKDPGDCLDVVNSRVQIYLQE